MTHQEIHFRTILQYIYRILFFDKDEKLQANEMEVFDYFYTEE